MPSFTINCPSRHPYSMEKKNKNPIIYWKSHVVFIKHDVWYYSFCLVCKAVSWWSAGVYLFLFLPRTLYAWKTVFTATEYFWFMFLYFYCKNRGVFLIHVCIDFFFDPKLCLLYVRFDPKSCWKKYHIICSFRFLPMYSYGYFFLFIFTSLFCNIDQRLNLQLLTDFNIIILSRKMNLLFLVLWLTTRIIKNRKNILQLVYRILILMHNLYIFHI